MIIPKKNQSWFQKNVLLLVAALIGVGIWWWFVGEHQVLGGLSNILTPHRHLR